MDAIDRVVKRLQHAAQKGTQAAAARTLARARELAPTATGALKASGRIEHRPEGAVILFAAPYAVVHQSPDLYHDDGQWQRSPNRTFQPRSSPRAARAGAKAASGRAADRKLGRLPAGFTPGGLRARDRDQRTPAVVVFFIASVARSTSRPRSSAVTVTSKRSSRSSAMPSAG